MKPYLFPRIAFFVILFTLKINLLAQNIETEVCVIGGGASGVAAAIQSARTGAKTVLIEETPWLGGMLTAAGVSCTDGNHWLPSGIWAEWRQKLYDYYGGPKEVATGWVSLTQFEPHVGAKIWADLAAAEPNLTVLTEVSFSKIQRTKKGDKWAIILRGAKKYKPLKLSDAKNATKQIDAQSIESQIVIDATELGDAAKMVGVKYRIGTDDPSETGEEGVAQKQSDIIQDLTFAAILKNYGKSNAPLVKKPANYDPTLFHCACSAKCPEAKGLVDCQKMLDYGKLPNGKYMINWPKHGNDFYANIIDADNATRQKAFKEAKNKTLAFIYYLQNDLGFKNLGLADDEFPTSDKLPFIPYHRESRRIEGLVTMTLNHISKPFSTEKPLYRTGIAVGDYPIDHHHAEYVGSVPVGDFPKVPSFNVPLGALIPKNVSNFIVAEKSISVSNVVNGTTRLQPVVLLIGQAAGVLAAISARDKVSPQSVSVRRVQSVLLKNGAYLMPYFDIKPDNPHFRAVQRIGATGLLRGVGEPHLWANRTWFYPDSTVSYNAFYQNYFNFNNQPSGGRLVEDRLLSVEDVVGDLLTVSKEKTGEKQANGEKWAALGLKNYDLKRPATRLELAVWLDATFNPFEMDIGFDGQLKK